jgi:FtsH-binding integral membrane protein
MKKDYRKIYWTIALIWGVIASICAVAYALLFDKDAPIDGQSSAMAVWNVAYWSVIVLLGASLLVAIVFALAQVIKGLKEDPKKTNGYHYSSCRFNSSICCFLLTFFRNRRTSRSI